MPIHVKQGVVGDGSHTAKQDLASEGVFGNKVFLQFWKNTAVFSNTAVLYTPSGVQKTGVLALSLKCKIN
jgi:hypothetical protein